MKKIFTLLTALFAVMAVNAQKITFAVDGSKTEWSSGDFKITATDTEGKIAIDANSTYFGTATEQVKYGARLKSGGKSTSKLFLTATIPADGTLKISARTGSNSATDRNVVVTQEDKEILNKILLESEAIKVKIEGEDEEQSVYPIISVPVKAGSAKITYPVGAINFYAIEFVEGTGGGDDPTPGEETDEFVSEIYEAIKWDGTAYTVAPEFLAVVPEGGGVATNVKDNQSVVEFGTSYLSVVAVSGTTPKDIENNVPQVFPGWEAWNDVKWEFKNQGDISFAWIMGTGNPSVEPIGAEAVLEDDGVTVKRWRGAYTYYGATTESVGGKNYKNEMPISGLYYKFTPKADGTLKISVRVNNGTRRTYIVEESSKQPVSYKTEGYINGQNYKEEDGNPDLVGKKKWLSSEQIKALHDANANLVKDGVDVEPWVIGAGNQPFFGNLIVEVNANKTYWMFMDSSQIGFGGYEFTPEGTSGISDIVVEKAQNDAIYNIAGQRVSGSAKGLVIKNGKKYFVK